MTTPLETALGYIGRGWNVTPVEYRGKKPLGNGWQLRVIDATNAAQYFNGEKLNIGAVLGPTSRKLTDVDLDCDEAIAIAPYILPRTRARFGRASKRESHRLYYTELSTVAGRPAVIAFDDPRKPKQQGRLIELRVGGDSGAQSVLPGSVHKTGETITWEEDGEPATVDGGDLLRRVKTVAAYTLLARYWPAEGSGHHDTARVVGGFLARAGLGPETIRGHVEAIAKAANSTRWKELCRTAEDAAKAFAGGKHAFGFHGLRETFGADTAEKVAEWLDYNPEVERQKSSEEQAGVTLDDFVAYMPAHSYIYTLTREMWPAVSVNARIPPVLLVDDDGKPILDDKGNRQYLAANAWLDRNQAVEQMTWAPGEPMQIEGRLVANGGWIKREGVTCFNLYRPPVALPGKPSKAIRWVRHIRKIYGNEATRHIIRYFAFKVQKPHEKINHALLLGGDQGIGKDTICAPLKYAVGQWNFDEVSPKHISGRFNSYVKSVILRVNEAHDLGDVSRFDFYEKMKVLTASPPEVLKVDEKHLREYNVFNVCGVVITTNYKTNGIYLPAEDRRHYAAWSTVKKEAFTEQYWTEFWAWYEAGGFGHVTAYLRNLDVSDFNPKAAPPKTEAFWEIVNANRSPEDAELADAIDRLGKEDPSKTTEDGEPVIIRPDVVTIDMVAAAADAETALWVRDRKNRRVIPHRLESCGYEPVRNDDAKSDGQWKIDGKRQTVYVRNDLSIRDRLAAVRLLTGHRSR
jgi:hypothetical protein